MILFTFLVAVIVTMVIASILLAGLVGGLSAVAFADVIVCIAIIVILTRIWIRSRG